MKQHIYKDITKNNFINNSMSVKNKPKNNFEIIYNNKSMRVQKRNKRKSLKSELAIIQDMIFSSFVPVSEDKIKKFYYTNLFE